MRDDFSQKTIETLAKRVGCRCSNPGCRKLASGPHEEVNKSVNIGVAAHITAAASGGKRYDASRSSEQRKSIENGIWLCQNCGKLIDSDEQKYPVTLLLNWKRETEEQAGLEIENAMPQVSGYSSSKFDDYLSHLVDTPQSWWLDAIDDSTWYEFELFTQVQENSKQTGAEKPKELTKPLLQAIDNVQKRAILITGAPGAGKSTFLEKLAIEAARKAQRDHDAPIPVLVELKDYDSSGEQSGIKGLIQSVLESYDPFLDLEATKQLLQGKGRTILLLIDGWNELSDKQAKSKIKTFCKPHCVIVTSRNTGDYWEIQQKFEIQPLSRSDVERFFDKKLPTNTERQQLRELVDRVRDFGQTPLMVWMLYSIFQDIGSTPETRGDVYREFTRLYSERAKEGIDLNDARKLLGKLAFEMMRSPNSEDLTDFRLKVSEVEAEDILGSEAELNRMLNHLLKQQGKLGNREISFCHQSLQEYYAAEYLRKELNQNLDWLKKQAGKGYSWFQTHYLNYLKWTEPIALMLGLPEINQDLASQIVEQALAVDLMLGARLAGEVRSGFQEKTIGLVKNAELPTHLKPPEWMKIELLGITRSDYAVPFLNHIIFESNDHSEFASSAAWELRHMSSHLVVPILEKAFQEKGKFVKYRVIEALIEINFDSAVSLALSEDDAETRYHAMHEIFKFCTEDSVISIVHLIALSKRNLKILQPKPIKYRADGLKDLTVEDTAFEFERNTMSFGTRFIKNMPLDIINPALLRCIEDSEDDSKIIALEILGELNQGNQPIAELISERIFEFEFDACVSALECVEKIQQEPPFFYDDVLDEDAKGMQILALKSRLINENGFPTGRVNAIPEISYLENEISDWLISWILKMLDASTIETSSYTATKIVEIAKHFPSQKSRLNITIPKVLELFRKSEGYTQGYFAQVLGILGLPGDQEICQALISTITEGTPTNFSHEILCAIGCLQCHGASSILLNQLNNIVNVDPLLRYSVLEILPNVQSSAMTLPDLWKLIDSNVGEIEISIFKTIQTIQATCKFYNYEIYQNAIDRPATARARGTPEVLAGIEQKLTKIDQRTKQMADQPKNDFTNATFSAPVNFGNNNQGNFIGTQNNYTLTPEIELAIADLKTLITNLKTQHPNITTETQALEIIDVEFTEIKRNPSHKLTTLRQQILNPERHLQAIKATAAEVTKHYLEESIWAKAIVTYLDKFRETPEKGA